MQLNIPEKKIIDLAEYYHQLKLSLGLSSIAEENWNDAEKYLIGIVGLNELRKEPLHEDMENEE